MKGEIKVVFATLLCALLFLSGCIKTSPETSAVVGKGIVITSFYPSLDEVNAGKNLRITLEIENQGSKGTKNVIACLIGSYEKNEKVLTQGMWYLKSEACYGVGKTLSPYDSESQSGGAARFVWELQAPYLSYPQERTDTFKGRVYFEYSTEATVKIPVYSMGEVQAMKQKGETVGEDIEITKTVAPVDISVSVKQPVIAEDKYFTMKITLTNTGNGVVFDPEKSFENKNSPPDLEDKIGVIRMEYVLPSGLKMDCDSMIEIFKGNSRTVSCEVEIEKPEEIKTMKIFPITIKAKYGYYVEKEANVKVLGTR